MEVLRHPKSRTDDVYMDDERLLFAKIDRVRNPKITA